MNFDEFCISKNLYVLIIIFFITECFIEAIPQTHLTLIMLVLDEKTLIYGGSGANDTDVTLFVVGFISSVLSASLGLARFLMNGPSKLVKKQGRLGGYLQVGFALLFFCILSTLVSKALWLALVLWGNPPLHAFVWMGASLVPQLILVRFFFSKPNI